MKIKAQFAMEYILVTAFAMLILLVSISVIYEQYDESRKFVSEDQINNIVREITVTAGKVYYMGEPAKATLELYFPEGIEDICIGGIEYRDPSTIDCSTKGVDFYTKKGGEIVYFAQNEVLMDPNNKIDLHKGFHRITLEAKDSLLLSIPTCIPSTCTNCLPFDCSSKHPGVLISEK